MKTLAIVTTALFLGVSNLSMAQSMKMQMTPSASSSTAAMPLVNGEVRKLDPATGLIVLKHQDIPNLAMPAMTMGFTVADKRMFNGIKVGDKVRFQAEMVKGNATVTELHGVR
jgi:Cu/Ag efflux protein CusF